MNPPKHTPLWNFEVEDIKALYAARPDLCEIIPNSNDIIIEIYKSQKEIPGLRIFRSDKVGLCCPICGINLKLTFTEWFNKNLYLCTNEECRTAFSEEEILAKNKNL